MVTVLTTTPTEREGLGRLVERLAPGGRLVRIRRLRGGLGSRMHVLEVEDAGGHRSKVVLRRRLADRDENHVGLEFRILQILELEQVPAPRPILLDAVGHYFEVPALVLSYLPGRALYPTQDLEKWVDGLARALVAVHHVIPDRLPITSRTPFLKGAMRAEIDHRKPEVVAAEPLAQAVQDALDAHLDRIQWVLPTLTHDDYWPGNTVWHRGRLVGIIDWADAVVGDRRTDVAQCRVDLVLSHGIEVADAFLNSYLAASAQPLPDMWFFDLFRGLRGLLSYERWLAGYQDLGLKHLTADVTGQRLRVFLKATLARLGHPDPRLGD